VMIHSKESSPKEIFEFCDRYRLLPNRVPLVVAPTTYSAVTEAELQEAGVQVVIYANHLLRSAYPRMVEAATSILENGRAMEAEELCLPIPEVLSLMERPSQAHG